METVKTHVFMSVPDRLLFYHVKNSSFIKRLMMILNKLKGKFKHFSYRIKSREHNFTEIFREGGFAGNEYPKSGTGSTLEQTKTIRRKLFAIIDRYEINTIIDAPCGDFTWMNYMNFEKFKYLGVDIVKDVILKNRELYSRENVEFYQCDIVNKILPSRDLILCRDCFVHLSIRDIEKALLNFRMSDSKYLLTTTFPSLTKNTNLVSGRGWRPLNLQIDPYNFPKPIEIIIEGCTELSNKFTDKALGLWHVKDIPF